MCDVIYFVYFRVILSGNESIILVSSNQWNIILLDESTVKYRRGLLKCSSWFSSPAGEQW